MGNARKFTTPFLLLESVAEGVVKQSNASK